MGDPIAQVKSPATDHAHLPGAVFVTQRPDGRWHGDMCDSGLRQLYPLGGLQARGERALLVGARAAGPAIVLALLDAGVVWALAVHDGDADRRDPLIDRLYGGR